MPLGLPGEAPYDAMIADAAQQWGVPADLIAAQLSVESSFNPKAVSPTGARGIAQFEPGTARMYGVDVNSPASSIAGEAHYLHDLQRATGSWDSALQAYSGNTAGYAAKVDAVAGHGGTSTTGGGAAPAAPAGTAGSVTDWLDSVAVRAGLVVLGGAMLVLGLRKATEG